MSVSIRVSGFFAAAVVSIALAAASIAAQPGKSPAGQLSPGHTRGSHHGLTLEMMQRPPSYTAPMGLMSPHTETQSYLFRQAVPLGPLGARVEVPTGGPEHMAAGHLLGATTLPHVFGPAHVEHGEATAARPTAGVITGTDQAGASQPNPTANPSLRRPAGAAGPGRRVRGPAGPGRPGPGHAAAAG